MVPDSHTSVQGIGYGLWGPASLLACYLHTFEWGCSHLHDPREAVADFPHYSNVRPECLLLGCKIVQQIRKQRKVHRTKTEGRRGVET